MRISSLILLSISIFGFAEYAFAQDLNLARISTATTYSRITYDPFGPNLAARLAYASGEYVWDPQSNTLISQSMMRSDKRETVNQLLTHRELVAGFKRRHQQKVRLSHCDSLSTLFDDCNAAADKFPAALEVTQASLISKPARSAAKR